MTIIGISGKKKTGKDTVYNYILQLYNGSITIERIGFADALKEEIAKAAGVTVEYIDQHKDNFRLILQGWGTDFRRTLDGQNYWINKLLLKLKASNARLVIVPDVRFKNEADAIREVGGYLIRVERATGLNDNHPSETELDRYKFDYVIHNDGNLDDLLRKTKAAILFLPYIFLPYITGKL